MNKKNFIGFIVSFIQSLPGQIQQLVFTLLSVDKPPSTVMAVMMTELQWSITVGRSFRRMTSCWLGTGISMTCYSVTAVTPIQITAALLALSDQVGLGDMDKIFYDNMGNVIF